MKQICLFAALSLALQSCAAQNAMLDRDSVERPASTRSHTYSLAQASIPIPDRNSHAPDKTVVLPPQPSGVPSIPLIPISRSEAPHIFNHKPTSMETDSVLSEGGDHLISILLKDTVKARVHASVNVQKSTIASDLGSDLSNINQIAAEVGAEVKSLYYDAQDLSEEQIVAEQAKFHARSGDQFPRLTSWITFKVPGLNNVAAKALLARLNADPNVEMAEFLPNWHANAVNNANPPTSEPKFPSDWSHNEYVNNQTFTELGSPISWYWWNRHSVGGAWQYGKGSGVTVAIIDRAFSPNATGQPATSDVTTYANPKSYHHGVVSTNVYPDAGTSPKVTGLNDDTNGENYYHGTACANFLAGSDSNGVGLCGVAPQATVTPIRALDSADIVNALYWSNTINASVVSMSIGIGQGVLGNNPENSSTYSAAMYSIWSRGGTLVIGAGNDALQVSMPTTGQNSYAIFVGGINAYDGYWTGTNYGPRVDMAAASSGTLTKNYVEYSNGTWASGTGFGYGEGTSYAAPLVAGAAALIRAQGITSAQAVRDILIYTSDILCAQTGGSYDSIHNTHIDGTYNGAYQMSSSHNGSEGWSKIRSLNCKLAAQTAHQIATGGTRYVVTCPASDDYTQIKRVDVNPNTFPSQGWTPLNALTGFTPYAQVECWTYKGGGQCSSNYNVFDNGVLAAYQCYGAGVLIDSLNQVVCGNWSSQGTQNGWVNRLGLNLTSTGVTTY